MPASPGAGFPTNADLMFNPITIAFVSKVLFNAVKLKPGVPEDRWLALTG
jgi:hypothetical protein